MDGARSLCVRTRNICVIAEANCDSKESTRKASKGKLDEKEFDANLVGIAATTREEVSCTVLPQKAHTL